MYVMYIFYDIRKIVHVGFEAFMVNKCTHVCLDNSLWQV